MSSTKQNKSLFALVDCNNFYASCERVFRPKLKHRPVVVLSNNDGCVIARSKEAKILGIPMGAPAFQYAQLFRLHRVEVCSSNYTLYGDMSSRVMQTLSQFSPDLQVYSIDEAFLMLESDHAEATSHAMRKTVLQWTGIPVSVGIAPTKTLAKVANHCAKKDPKHNGVFLMTDPILQEEILQKLPVGEVWGIGRQITETLSRNGIRTAWELRNSDDNWIKKRLSVTGLRTVWELRGISCLQLEEVDLPKKSIICSRSFGRPVSELHELEEAVAAYMARAAEKARLQDSVAGFIQVFLMTSKHQPGSFYGNRAQVVLPQSTSYTPELIHYAKQALKSLFVPGLAYKKTGVLLGGLEPASAFQPDLFCAQGGALEKQRAVMELMDKTNKNFGRKVLRMAAEGTTQDWKARSGSCSPHFTTRWDELLTLQL